MTIKRTINGEEVDIELTAQEREAIYREVWTDYVCLDVVERLEELGNHLTFGSVKRIASAYVRGAYDCDLSYWENIDALIDEFIWE